MGNEDVIPDGIASRGKRIFILRCIHCHTIDPGKPHKKGPNLSGIYDRLVAVAPGFNYALGNKFRGKIWDEETLFTFLKAPKKYIRGLEALCPETTNKKERANVIAYLKTLR